MADESRIIIIYDSQRRQRNTIIILLPNLVIDCFIVIYYLSWQPMKTDSVIYDNTKKNLCAGVIITNFDLRIKYYVKFFSA